MLVRENGFTVIHDFACISDRQNSRNLYKDTNRGGIDFSQESWSDLNPNPEMCIT